MKKKIIGIFICTLLIATMLPITGSVIAGDENDPEIVDDPDTDVFDYLDIISAWFYENADEPDYLFTALKIKEISPLYFKQHLTVHWEHNGVECASGMHIGVNHGLILAMDMVTAGGSRNIIRESKESMMRKQV